MRPGIDRDGEDVSCGAGMAGLDSRCRDKNRRQQERNTGVLPLRQAQGQNDNPLLGAGE
jgi:hypothetical protein